MGGRTSCLVRSSSTLSIVAEVQHEMEAIGYLLRLRCAERRPFGIKTATISRNRHDFGMVSEPFRETVRGSVREEVDNVADVHIDQNGSILLAFAPSPIVDT